MPLRSTRTNLKTSGDAWKQISSAIQDIFNHKQSSLSLSQLHGCVGQMLAENSFCKLADGFATLFKEQFAKWYTEIFTLAGNPLISGFSSFYNDFKVYCSLIPKIFMLFDKSYQEQHNVCFSNSLQILRQHYVNQILSDSTLMGSLTHGILLEVLKIRRHSENVQENIRNLIQMFYSFHNCEPRLTLFSDFFDSFFHQTTLFYNEFFKSHFEGNTFVNYLIATQEQFKHEETLIRSIFHSSEVDEILQNVCFTLLFGKEDFFLNNEEPLISSALVAVDYHPMRWLVNLYQHFRFDLTNVYTSCAQFVGHEMLKHTQNFSKNMKASEATARIQELINHTEKLEKTYTLIFKGIKPALDELERQIKVAWNDGRFNIIQNFCTYIDSIVTSDFKTFSVDERDAFPLIFAKFYARISERLEFNSLYERFYVRRFIRMGTRLQRIEEPLLTKVQSNAKASDFAKSFQMFYEKLQDSAKMEQDFKDSLARRSSATCKSNLARTFSPLVFEQRTFPLDRIGVNRLPPELDQINRQFLEYHAEKHPKAKLMLLSDLSNVESKMRFPKTGKIYTISSDIVCASILRAVAVAHEISLGDINDQVGEDRGRIAMYLKRLCQKSCPILLRKKYSETCLQESDVFCFNPNFTFQSLKVTVQPIVDNREKDHQSTQQQVSMDKNLSLKAHIIRCLKSTNRVPLSTLNNTVIQWTSQLFKADTKMIGKQLQVLEGEYFERSDDLDDPVLTYIAQ